MDMAAFEKRKQLLDLRMRVLQAEEERIRGARTMSVDEARETLDHAEDINGKG